MIHRFSSVLLFIGVVAAGIYSISSAVQAGNNNELQTTSATAAEGSSDTKAAPREVRIAIVSPESPTTTATALATDLHEEAVSSTEEDGAANQVSTTTAPVVAALAENKETQESADGTKKESDIFTVPFYSQFADISSPSWQKVGCGIASVAMLIDFYSNDTLSVDGLLRQGIAAGAYLDDAGWTHRGLINLAAPYGLNGESVSLSQLSADAAFAKLRTVVAEGPVMASVHYTFEPTNPIPHLVVINGVRDGMVHYNDPAEVRGAGSLSIEKFQRAWKQRYISIRPTS